MKKILLSALFIVPTIVMGQIIDENFDSYNAQDYAGVVSPVMNTWSGNTGAGTDDCLVTSAESSSGANSIVITGPNAGGSIDAMVTFPSDYTTGSFEYSMKYKVAAGMVGYFNCHSTSTPPDRWMLQVYFAADGTGLSEMGGNSIIFNYTNGAWIDILVTVDLDADFAHFFVEGVEVGPGFIWSAESGGAASGDAQFGGVNLYSASGDPIADCEYYVDDIMLVETTGVGIEEITLNPIFSVVPNPSNGNFTVNYKELDMASAEIQVVDVLGSVVYSSNSQLIGNGSIDFDLNLNTGVYFVRINDGATVLTERVIVKK